jgi:hypothetical protein
MQPVIPLTLAGLLVLGVGVALVVARAVSGQHTARPGCALPFPELLRRIEDEDQGGRHRLLPISVAPDNNHGDHGDTDIPRRYPHEQLRLAS